MLTISWRRELEIELAEGQAKLQRLRKQVEEEAKSPPEWVSEIHRLRSEVARFKASANRPVRDSVAAAMSVPCQSSEQRLRAWMEEENLEMRDALDANDAEAIVSLGP